MKRYFKYVKPYWPYFIIGPLCMIVEVVGEVLMPSFLAGIIDDGAVNPNVGYIITMSLVMVATALIMMLGGIGGAYFGAKAAVNFAADLRYDLFAKVQSLSFSNIDKFHTGSLVTRMTNDVTQLQNFVNMLLRMFLRSPGMLIGAVIMAITLNPRLASVLALVIPLLVIVQAIIIRIAFPRFGEMQTRLDALNSNIQENITNVRVVKSFVREEHEAKRFGETNGNLKNTAIRAIKVMIFMMPVMTLIMNLTSLSVVWLGGNNVISESMTVGDLTAFVTYITQILMSLMMMTMLFMTSSRALASSKRICEVLDEKPEINDFEAACKEKEVTRGEIEFRGVSFRYYKNSEEKVLDNVTFTIDAGSTVGIIGSTGSGKTTLVSMIPRLYDADEGEILVDGTNVRDYDLKNLREGVSMVLQKNLLFSGTIRDNLLWGNENADDGEIRAAAKSAQADQFVTSFTAGYDTELGQGGVNVSGGQKQRLCIARALLKKPKILILDDSTSALDTATEANVRAALKSELPDATKIIIAQRIGSVKEADKIIVMNDGVISGIGTHDELLEGNKDYQEIYYSQVDRKEARD